MDRVSYSEWAILRYSPEPKFGRISILRKQLSWGVPPGCALVSGSRHPSFLPVAAAVALAAISMVQTTYAQRADAGDWIETWTASPQLSGMPNSFAHQHSAGFEEPDGAADRGHQHWRQPRARGAVQ